MVSLATKFPNVYIDTSTYSAKRHPSELVVYRSGGHGRGKVLFGSNHPAWAADVCFAGLEELHVDADVAELFLVGNAARVVGLSSMLESTSRP